jgi:nicotinamide mononucleotide transporter
MSFFDISSIAFQIWNYSVSYVELIGTLFGLISVYFAAKANILTWVTGIINELFLFILFFQIQLYADTFLQLYFFITTLYGWYNWKSKSTEHDISGITLLNRLWLAGIIVAGTTAAGFLFRNIHLILPQYFKVPAAYPFIDSFVMICSITATILLARKKLENWYLWIAADVVSVGLYFKKQVYFLSLEYLIFLGLATYGLYNWRKQLQDD